MSNISIHFLKGAIVDANTTAKAGDELSVPESLARAFIAEGIAYSLETPSSGPKDTVIAELVDTDGTLAGNSDAMIASQKAVKTYIDTGRLVAINSQSGDYTLALSDAGKMIRMTKATANTLTVPANSSVAFPVGTSLRIRQAGAGVTTLAAAGGVTLNNPGTDLHFAKQNATAQLIKVGTDAWDIIGGTTGA